jgi:predicted GNAT family acetyltransferase
VSAPSARARWAATLRWWAATTPSYVVRDNPAEFRYEILREGDPLGFIQYWISGDRIGLVHTELLSSAKGHGVGSRLMAGALPTFVRAGSASFPLPVRGRLSPAASRAA